ncbi:hypothetical protein SLA2020_400120 [Shorea laevis]
MVADYWLDGCWDLNSLRVWLSNELIYQLQLVQLDDKNGVQDLIYWRHTTHGNFSTSSAYELLIKSISSPIAGSWEMLWQVKAAPKAKSLLWLMLHNRVLTNSSRMARGLTTDDLCPRCQNGSEDILHCFRDCPSSRRVWSRWISDTLWQQWQGMDQIEWIHHNLSRGNVLIEHNLPWSSAFPAICWYIWLARNKAVFEGDKDWIISKEHQLRYHLMEATLGLKKHIRTPRFEQLIGWERPPSGFVKINVDGSTRGTPGESAAGGLCRDSNGDWIFGFTQHLGMGYAIRAELFAIWKGLTLAWEKGYRKVIIETDSLLAKQKLQSLGSANALYPLCRDCIELINRNWVCELRHVFREANSCADSMASSFYHLAKGFYFFEEPPDIVRDNIRNDSLGVCKPRASRLFSA